MRDARLRLRLWRTARPGRARAGFDDVVVSADPAADCVLDVIERAWAEVDPTLVFRHACHHASCGTCAVRVNGRERLPCVTSLGEVWNGRQRSRSSPCETSRSSPTWRWTPLSQLARLAELRFPYVRTVEADVRCAVGPVGDEDIGTAERFEDCLECLACVSACPVALGLAGVPGPRRPCGRAAHRRGAARRRREPRPRPRRHAITASGSAARSSPAARSVRPAVDPAARIMDLRRRLLERAPATAGASV